jgi:hypothetical protein
LQQRMDLRQCPRDFMQRTFHYEATLRAKSSTSHGTTASLATTRWFVTNESYSDLHGKIY